VDASLSTMKRDGIRWQSVGMGVGSVGAPMGIGVLRPSIGAAVMIVELILVFTVAGTALFGSHELSERAFRLLWWIRNRSEPTSPMTERNQRPVIRVPHAEAQPRCPALSTISPLHGSAPGRGQYQARPGRSAVVVPDLADLRGPVTGTVELPLWLFWSQPDRTFDLDDPDMRQWLYEIVLREAGSREDLTTYLDRDTLIALWPRLYLPKGVRLAWEDQHASLRSAVAVA
jgi:hypothetical protein